MTRQRMRPPLILPTSDTRWHGELAGVILTIIAIAAGVWLYVIGMGLLIEIIVHPVAIAVAWLLLRGWSVGKLWERDEKTADFR